MKNFTSIAVLVLSLVSAVSAQTTPTTRNAATGAVLGAGVGAIVGHNSKSHNTGKGAAIGAAAGFILGTVAGQVQEYHRPVCVSSYPVIPVSRPVTIVQTRPVGYSYGNSYGSDYGTGYGSGCDQDSHDLARQAAEREAECARRRYANALEMLRTAQANVALAEARMHAAENTLAELGGR